MYVPSCHAPEVELQWHDCVLWNSVETRFKNSLHNPFRRTNRTSFVGEDSWEDTTMAFQRLTNEQRKKLTKFQYDVYNKVMQVPRGQVVTYSEVAKAIKCNSSRAVGQALKRNPYAPTVPCHRVVKSDLSVGGFKGSLSLGSEKMRLLREEGVDFEQNGNDIWVVSRPSVYSFNDETWSLHHHKIKFRNDRRIKAIRKAPL